MDAFDRVWAVLERQGKCDSRGGVEYTRVRKEWEEIGEAFVILMWITNRSNIDPTDNVKTLAKVRRKKSSAKPSARST